MFLSRWTPQSSSVALLTYGWNAKPSIWRMAWNTVLISTFTESLWTLLLCPSALSMMTRDKKYQTLRWTQMLIILGRTQSSQLQTRKLLIKWLQPIAVSPKEVKIKKFLQILLLPLRKTPQMISLKEETLVTSNNPFQESCPLALLPIKTSQKNLTFGYT